MSGIGLFHVPLVLLFLLTLGLAGGCGQDAAVGLHLQRITGTTKCLVGDDPLWSSPEFNDAGWSENCPESVPENPSADFSGTSWRRIRFGPMGYSPDLKPGLLVEGVGQAHEIFLNGTLIGGQGVIGPGFTETPTGQWLYRLPEGLLNFEDSNLAAVRMLNSAPMAIKPVILHFGDFRDIRLGILRLGFTRMVLEISVITTFLIFLIVSFFIYVNGMRENEYTAFMLLVLLYLLVYTLDTYLFYQTGLKNSWVQRSIFFLTMLIPASGLWFIFLANKAGPDRLARIFIGASLLLALALLFAGDYECYHFLEPYCLSVIIGTLIFVLIEALKAFYRNRPESGPVLLGVMGLVLASVLDTLGVFEAGLWQPLQTYDFGFVFFLFCLAYGLMARYVRTYADWRSLSRKILIAHQDERRRFSRDIHDGVGQSILAVRMQLQMTAAELKQTDPDRAAGLGRLITDLSECSSELRDMAMDLRPAFLEETTLFELIDWYGGQFAAKTGIALETEGETDIDVPVGIKDNIYRICQEALGNIAKHARAARVSINLQMNGGRLTIVIKDDGRGFDPLVKARANSGIGLMSMRERTELLGGTFQVVSSPGRGCTIRIDLPAS